VSIAMRLNFIGAVLGWCVTTQLWHEMPLGRPPQQSALRAAGITPPACRSALRKAGLRAVGLQRHHDPTVFGQALCIHYDAAVCIDTLFGVKIVSPIMQRTHHRGAPKQPIGQRSAAMRATRLGREHRAGLSVEDRDRLALDNKVAALARRYLRLATDPTYRNQTAV